MVRNGDFFLIYSDDTEKLKVNLEDLKRFKARQIERRSKKNAAKEVARNDARRKGLKLGRWQGTYARIKYGDNGFYHLNTGTVVESRPGPMEGGVGEKIP